MWENISILRTCGGTHNYEIDYHINLSLTLSVSKSCGIINFTCIRKVKGAPWNFFTPSLYSLSYWTLSPILTNLGWIYLPSYSYDVLSSRCLKLFLSLKGFDFIYECFDWLVYDRYFC